jgi:hypothetical protein
LDSKNAHLHVQQALEIVKEHVEDNPEEYKYEQIEFEAIFSL